MTSQGLLNSIEALEYLGLYDPDRKPKPNVTYLTWLHKRGLLKREKKGHHTIRYKKSSLDACLKKAEELGELLTTKPSNP